MITGIMAKVERSPCVGRFDTHEHILSPVYPIKDPRLYSHFRDEDRRGWGLWGCGGSGGGGGEQPWQDHMGEI